MGCEISSNFYESSGITLQNLCMCLQECYTKCDIDVPGLIYFGVLCQMESDQFLFFPYFIIVGLY